MFYSEKYGFLYIASPKSGSKSTQQILTKIDPDGQVVNVTINGKKLVSKDFPRGIVGHAKAWEFRKVLGEQTFDRLIKLGFVRHPLEKLVSTYHFNKKKSAFSAFTGKGKNYSLRNKLREFLTKFFPKILPFSIWALFFPMKTSYEYFYDKNGTRLVDFLGRTAFLNEDLELFLKEYSIVGFATVSSIHINKSTHDSWHTYYRNRIILRILGKRYKRDIDLYQQVQEEIMKVKR